MPQQTPLYKIHKQLGARMVDFAGWEMPVLYKGVIEEHHTVRNKSGIFDVSHMGELLVHGSKAESVLQKVTCNDVTPLKPGDCQYSALLTERGTFVDDIIVNKISQDRFLICVNASNTEKDFQWVKQFENPTAHVEDVSTQYFQIALQGPESEKILASIDSTTPQPKKYYTFVETKLLGSPVLLARTGYTGEDGFEIYGSPKDAEKIWTTLMESGATPIGLGARDTLRLESAYPLYGHEINDTIHPFESRLSWIVKMNKGDFVGRKALEKIRNNVGAPLGEPKQLVGLMMEEPGIARQGCKIFSGEKEIGFVTSGTKSPTLDRAIALGYVKKDFEKENLKIEVDIHNKKRHAIVVSLPFYRQKK